MNFEQKYLKYKAKYLNSIKSQNQRGGTLYNIHSTAGARGEIRIALSGKGITKAQADDIFADIDDFEARNEMNAINEIVGLINARLGRNVVYYRVANWRPGTSALTT